MRHCHLVRLVAHHIGRFQVPVVQGTDLLTSAEDALQAAERIGYPVSLTALAATDSEC